MMKWDILDSDLASIAKLSFEKDAAETGSIGFVNISTATSMLHDIPDWKRCVGALVVPGGAHNELDYCVKEEDLVYLEKNSRLIIADIVRQKVS